MTGYERLGSSLLITVAGIACGVGLWLPSAVPEVAAVRTEQWIGVSSPSKRAAIGPAQAGVIREMVIREGELVKAGQVLLRLDSAIEELEAKRLGILAASDTPQREALAFLKYTKRRFLRLKGLDEKDIANPAEFELAEHEYQVAQLRVEGAKLDMERAQLEAARGIARLEERTIRAPLTGIVSQIFFQEGEPAEKLIPMIEVVTLDPLWVEFDCPVEEIDQFSVGTEVAVRRAAIGGERRIAKVIHSSMTADASSHTTRVRLELENKPPWRAGLQMWIEASKAAQPPSGK